MVSRPQSMQTASKCSCCQELEALLSMRLLRAPSAVINLLPIYLLLGLLVSQGEGIMRRQAFDCRPHVQSQVCSPHPATSPAAARMFSSLLVVCIAYSLKYSQRSTSVRP